MTRVGKNCSIAVLFAALITLGACGSDSPASRSTTIAPVVPGTNSVSDLIMSACITGASRADLRGWLEATGRSADKVELFLQQYDLMVKTGDCN